MTTLTITLLVGAVVAALMLVVARVSRDLVGCVAEALGSAA